MVRLRWVLFWALTLLLGAILSTALLREWSRMGDLEALVKAKERKLENLSSQLERMDEKSAFYRTDSGKARLAREYFNLVLPGERIFKVLIESDDMLPVGER